MDAYILIEKTKEPESWLLHRLTPGAKYEPTADLRKSLLTDQGYVCAYCMRRIPVADKGANETSHIEHVRPQSCLTNKEAMDYDNMVICCPGAINSTSAKLCHCDRHKRETPISFSPFDENFISTISYSGDGTIKSSNPVYDKELNEVLNLNVDILKANRKEVRKKLTASFGKRQIKKSDLEKILKIYSSKDVAGMRKEYCGVVIHYLTRRLNRI